MKKTMVQESESLRRVSTIVDVAALAKVSIGSVSRVLNQHESVKKSTRLKVINAINQLEYKPNMAAQSIRGKMSRTITCILKDVETPGFGRFVVAADKVFMEAGYALMLCNTEGDKSRERDLIALVSARRSDAILIAHSSEIDPELEKQISEAKVPVVLFDRESPGWADAVVVDHRSATRIATEKLLKLGHRRIALITGHPDLYPARSRVQGYKEAHQKFDIFCDPSLCRQGWFGADFAFEQTSLLASASNRPTAIIAGGIPILPGVLRALRVLRLSIPNDISVIGANETDLTELHTPAISVVSWDYAAMGKIAANLTLERLRNKTPSEPRRVVVPAEFLYRESISKPNQKNSLN
jgi:LacI family transcriptional regulator